MNYKRGAGFVVFRSVPDAEKEIAVVVNRKGTVSLPKGTEKPGESPWDTAIRELGEETGIFDPKPVCHLGVVERVTNPGTLCQTVFFLGKTSTSELSPHAKDIRHALWVPESEVCKTLTHPSQASLIETVLGHGLLDQPVTPQCLRVIGQEVLQVA